MLATIIPFSCESDTKQVSHYVVPYERKQCIDRNDFCVFGIKICDEQGAPFPFNSGTKVTVVVHLETMDGSLVWML